MTLEKTFIPAMLEPQLYAAWEASGLLAAGHRPEAQPYTIMMPPPNVTGSLHMGHAFGYTLQDILVRFHRLQGRDVLWQPGTDHAGIATQMVVERQLDQEHLSRRTLGREKFLERVWQWKEESGSTITRQLRRLGASPDWSRERFTMDEGLSAAVRRVFVQLYREELIYRDKRLINWDPKLQTAISDLEVETLEKEGSVYYYRYPIEGDTFITIATTRPETTFGDVAIAVHPEDARYAALIGKKARHPLTGSLIPIIGDLYADPEKFTGAVKITPAHDFNDFEIGRRHNLPLINILDAHACLNENVPDAYQGLDRFTARKKVIEDLEEKGLFDRQETTLIPTPHSDRSGAVIEPWLMDQWYVNAAELAKEAVKAVEDGRTQFVPQFWENTYFEWLRNIQPWCISRQLWWGHRIPAWYGPDGKIFVGMQEEEAQKEADLFYGKPTPLTQDEDVLDTWFSSALWPFSTLGWPEETPELERYYPTDVLVTGHDIIFFWVARMMMMGLHFTKKVPFKTVYINALVRDAKGQKMSKTKGNVIDPLGLMDEYGADALRFTLAALASPGRDVKFSTAQVEGYRNFATKLWNAARFAEMNGCRFDVAFDPEKVTLPLNQWILLHLMTLEQEVTTALEAYKFNEAAHALYHFIWGTFCDWYLEFCKSKFTSDGPEKTETQSTVAFVLSTLLRLLHPFMPYITEALWAHLRPDQGLLMGASWPETVALPKTFKQAKEDMDWVIRMITEVRRVRTASNAPPGAFIPLHLYDTRPDIVRQNEPFVIDRLVRENEDLLLKLARLSEIRAFEGPPSSEATKEAAQGQVGMTTVFLPLAGIIDIQAEKTRLRKELIKAKAETQEMTERLHKSERAPQAIKDLLEERLKKAIFAEREIERAFNSLGGSGD